MLYVPFKLTPLTPTSTQRSVLQLLYVPFKLTPLTPLICSCLVATDCMHLSFSSLLHQSCTIIWRTASCMHLSFSSLLHLYATNEAESELYVPFIFHTSYTSVRNFAPLYVPFKFTPLTPIEHRVYPQHALYVPFIFHTSYTP